MNITEIIKFLDNEHFDEHRNYNPDIATYEPHQHYEICNALIIVIEFLIKKYNCKE